MRRVTLLTPQQAVDEANRFGVTGDVTGSSMDAMISTQEIRPIDSVLPGALWALRRAVDSGELALGRLQTDLNHPEPSAAEKRWLPQERHGAWLEAVDLRLAAIRIGEPEEDDRGYLFIVQKKRGVELDLWACDQRRQWLPARAAPMLIPEALDIVRSLEEHGLGPLLAQGEQTELEAIITPAPSSSRPRV